jgi:hypothetical protein
MEEHCGDEWFRKLTSKSAVKTHDKNGKFFQLSQ